MTMRIIRSSFLGALIAAQLLVSATGAQAQGGDKVRWEDIAGVTTPIIGVNAPPGGNVSAVVNDVQGIPPGGRPWFTTRGQAEFSPSTGDLRFRVRGLVLLGGNAAGTPGAITTVKGTIVCNGPIIIDSTPVPLSPEGDAEFNGQVAPTPGCANPIFLIRIGPGTAGSTQNPWIAAGVVRRD